MSGLRNTDGVRDGSAEGRGVHRTTHLSMFRLWRHPHNRGEDNSSRLAPSLGIALRADALRCPWQTHGFCRIGSMTQTAHNAANRIVHVAGGNITRTFCGALALCLLCANSGHSVVSFDTGMVDRQQAAIVAPPRWSTFSPLTMRPGLTIRYGSTSVNLILTCNYSSVLNFKPRLSILVSQDANKK